MPIAPDFKISDIAPDIDEPGVREALKCFDEIDWVAVFKEPRLVAGDRGANEPR